jgi:hypothetical protein
MSVRVTTTGASWGATVPSAVLKTGSWSPAGVFVTSWDVSSDGRRFLVVEPPALGAPDLFIVQHWDRETRVKTSTR